MATDYFYGVDATGGVSSKPHGFTATGYESLTSNFEFITIVMSATDIRPLSQSGGTATSQGNLDKLIQIVSERGQPVIMGNVTGGSNDTVILAIEHPSAWQCVQGVTGSQLRDRINNDGLNYWSATLNPTITFSNVLT